MVYDGNDDRNMQFLSYFLNNDLPEYYEDKHNAIHFPFENKKETTGSKRDNTLPKVYTYRLGPYSVNQESGDSEIVQHRLLSGTGNPLVQNIFSTVDIDVDRNKKNSSYFTRESKLLQLLRSINTLKAVQGSLPLGLVKTTGHFDINTDMYSRDDHTSVEAMTTKQKRFVISFSAPSLRYARRRKIKGKRIRHNNKSNKQFRIDPTYFLFGIGKRSK